MKNLKHLTDEELAQHLKDGDVLAFEELYSRYWDKLYLTAAKRVSSAEAAEEIVQDFFTSLWLNRAKLSIHTAFSNYVYSSVRYLVYNYYQKESVRRAYQEKMLPLTPSIDTSTEDQIALNDLSRTLQTEVKNLPAKCRSVFELSRQEHKNNKEIARLLGISEKTVENHLTKALRNLRLSLKDGMFIFAAFIALFCKN